MDSAKNKPTSQRAQRFLDRWSILVGPEYAARLYRIWWATILSIPVMFIGGVLAVAAAVNIPHLTTSEGKTVTVSFLAVVIAPLVASRIRLIMLMSRMKRDLTAAGFTQQRGGPDLRTESHFRLWSKRSGITAEDVISAARPTNECAGSADRSDSPGS